MSAWAAWQSGASLGPKLAGLAWHLTALTFECSIALLVIIWLAYPAAVGLWAWLRPYRGPRAAATWPSLTIIVAAHNEAAHIAARVRDLWAQSYAGEAEILVSEDGSSDGTAARVRALMAAAAAGSEAAPYPLRLLSAPERLGKAEALNRAVREARGEVLVFTDANNRFAPGALEQLAAPFADASVGAVTGRKAVAAGTGMGGGESVYFRFESWLMAQEART